MIEELQQLGLTKNEAKIYLAILSKGPVKVGQILKEADISTGKVYDVLESMRRKGIVSIVLRDGIKTVVASPPLKIKDLVRQKELEIRMTRAKAEAVLPALTKLYTSQAQEYEFEVFTGDDGLAVATQKILAELRAGEEILCLAVAERKMTVELVWRGFAREALDKKCRFKFITSRKKLTSKGLWLFKELHAEYRIVNLPTVSPITVTKKYVFINDYPSSSHILIKSPTVVKIFENMFTSLWQYGEKK